MPTSPKSENVHTAREQAAQAIGGAVAQARTPFLAALGAGDLATQTVVEGLNKVRTQLGERAESARAGVNDLPSDFTELREKLDPTELRKVVDAYTKSAVQFYNSLANRGEDALGRLRSQPQVQRAWSQVETAQGRVEGAVEEVRELADDVLGKVTHSTRSFGEKAARTTEKAAGETAETVRETAKEAADVVEEAGAKAASTTRSAARKTASRTAGAKSTSGSKQQSKPTSSKSTTS
jgi:heparin binding hemagglutinin HbhA